ncbi:MULTISPECIES: RDD family protein [Vibrio]|uniref:RDD family protein n=1 Tax=Vibrio TaxID=662 RepID=UPI001EDFB5B9|nr:RDD family protein [Vibrio cincinnatiensis]
MRIEPRLGSMNFDEDKEEVVYESLAKEESLAELLLNSKLASPGRRYIGQFIDLVVTWIIFLVTLLSLENLNFTEEESAIISIFLSISYLLLSDALPSGKSFGKRLLGISVIDKTTGKYCTIWQSFLRNVLTPLIGLIDAIFILSKRRQRLGDMAANTIVVESKIANKRLKEDCQH